MQPGNNKQHVPLALEIINETVIATARNYFPTGLDLSGFLNLIIIWWTISYSKQRYTPIILENTIIIYTGKKTDFKLPCQTKSTLVTTLRAQADLIGELIDDGQKFVKTTRLQVIPLKGVFNNIGN